MQRATAEEFEAWKAECIADSSKLDRSLPKSVADMWRKQWGITGTTVVKTTSFRLSNRGVGVSIGITEDSTINQVIDFAFRLQMMRSAGIISQEFWLIGAKSIQEWLADNNMDWNSLLASMKEQVA